MNASIIIPVYNQLEHLLITLKYFNEQIIDKMHKFEVIVVDDGSTGLVQNSIREEEYNYDLKIIRQDNKGRAIARNKGVENSKYDTIIFCDADRIPSKNFVELHIKNQISNLNTLSIGSIQEIYISNLKILSEKLESNTYSLEKHARVPNYPRLISNLFDSLGNTDTQMPWIATFTGNMSLPKSMFYKVGGFSEKFVEWGFEHFEFGYRLYKENLNFVNNKQAANYHIAHRRDLSELRDNIKKSILIMNEMYPADTIISDFGQFMLGEKSLQNIEPNKNASWLQEKQKDIMFTAGLI